MSKQKKCRKNKKLSKNEVIRRNIQSFKAKLPLFKNIKIEVKRK